MIHHHILLILSVIFINRVSPAKHLADTDDVSVITASIKRSTNDVKCRITEEQRKTSTETYDGENLEKINSSGSFLYRGEVRSPVTIEKNSGTVHLYIDDANFSIPGAKVIDAKSGVELVITLVGDSTISNAGGGSSNAISAISDVTVNGEGSLRIVSSKNGIKSGRTFFSLGGSLAVSSSNHGISSDSLFVSGGSIKVEETGNGKDGLHAETDYDGVSESPSFDFLKGFVYIENGTINIENCDGDGIQADSFVYVAGGKVSIKTDPTWEAFVATANGMKGCFSKSGDSYAKVASDNVRRGATYYILSSSCKGIKVGEIDYYLKDDTTETEQDVASSFYTTLIEGGSIEIDSADDAIHTNSGNTLIYGGQINLRTLDDGINADLRVIVKDGDIDIETSFEGIEGQFVEIEGGTIKVISDDDGINAAGGRDSRIVFSGGKTYVYAKGDGLDSNGDLFVNGGEVYVLQTGSWNGALDSDGEIVVNGGTLVAVGSSGMPEIPSSSSSQCVIAREISATADDISLIGSSGDTIVSFEISSVFGERVSYSLVVLSSSSIKKCESYQIVTGRTTNSVVTSGSSTVTSNVRTGWRPVGGSSSNDGENCPASPASSLGTTITTTGSRTNSGASSTASSNSRSSFGVSSIYNDDLIKYTSTAASPAATPNTGPSSGGVESNDDVSARNATKGKGLSTGGIIGIAIACVVVAGLAVGLLVYFFVIKNKAGIQSSLEE